MYRNVVFGVSAVAIAFAAFLNVPAQAANAGVKVGILNCNVDSGFGFILGSSRDIRCNYVPSSGAGERYTGAISRVGVDIGYTRGGVLIWNVVAPASNVAPGALAGTYVGATASATIGVGLGANVLIGGLNQSVALQPLSIEGNTGLNVAAGIGALTLTRAQ
jgi:hypothetical protein